jgi:hypothetical protein
MYKDEFIIPHLYKYTSVYDLSENHKNELLKYNLIDDVHYTLDLVRYVVYYGTIEYTINKQTKYFNLDGMTYIGEINYKNQRHGIGITSYSSYFTKNNNYNEKKYIGQYAYDNKHGIGKINFWDNSLFIGDWNKNKRDGYGYLYIKDMYIYTGYWSNNHFNGHGILNILDNVKYEGKWYNSSLDGYCRKTYNNGIIHYSIWNKGVKKNNYTIISSMYNEIVNPLYYNKYSS